MTRPPSRGGRWNLTQALPSLSLYLSTNTYVRPIGPIIAVQLLCRLDRTVEAHGKPEGVFSWES